MDGLIGITDDYAECTPSNLSRVEMQYNICSIYNEPPLTLQQLARTRRWQYEPMQC